MSHPEFVQILRWNPALMPKIPAVVSCSNFGSLMRFSQIWKSKCLTFPTWENHGKIHHGAMVGKEYGHSNTQWIWESPNISRVVKPEPPFLTYYHQLPAERDFCTSSLWSAWSCESCLYHWFHKIPLYYSFLRGFFVSPATPHKILDHGNQVPNLTKRCEVPWPDPSHLRRQVAEILAHAAFDQSSAPGRNTIWHMGMGQKPGT